MVPKSAFGSSAHAEIDPQPFIPSRWQAWLLRTRGDRPVLFPWGGHPHRAPPHTRRSTRQSLRWTIRRKAPPHTRRSTRVYRYGRVGLAGSSAHAEIDPSLWDQGLGSPRLLRTRGDRPPAASSSCLVQEAPPHTRRSTLRIPRARSALFGSSAHAEIDPPLCSLVRLVSGLLRTRGDRPSGRCKRASGDVAPPHTRRSTLTSTGPLTASSGSSAHAEIDRHKGYRSHVRLRLLRTRGDRPYKHGRNKEITGAPPHTRRSTPCSSQTSPCCSGSSAHAEIDPGFNTPKSSPFGLLRTRGDGPIRPRLTKVHQLVPPPMRRSPPDLPGR